MPNKKEIAIQTRKLCRWVGLTKFYNDFSEVDYSKKETLKELEDSLDYYENLLDFDISKKTLIRFYFSGYQFFKRKAESKLWFGKLRSQRRCDEFWNLYCFLVNTNSESKPLKTQTYSLNCE